MNYNSFSNVAPFLLLNSELYKSQEALVTSYYVRGLEQEILNFNIIKVEELGPGEARIKVSETIGIYVDYEYREETFKWWYYARNLTKCKEAPDSH
ncbi:TcaA NTF2-like domain-containing protein [Anaerobacillus sp. CMMVII]|uniref:TcaA NTF2-like domain-containing protein n=1 Tax=Anaerobacillus sp. CMMVII TaxID=2755588 RepID=UPI0037BE60AE